MGKPRLIIIGLDSVSPRIAFEIFDEVTPCLSSLRRKGLFGPLRSTRPPITVPAWVTMTSGLDPGELGIYGFRNRKALSYEMGLVTSKDVVHPRLWDLAAGSDLTSVVVSVPVTFPPKIGGRGIMASCFLTPGPESTWLDPPYQRAEIESQFGPYLVDVRSFRTDDKPRLIAGCRELTSQHFGIFRYLIESRAPDFAMLVDLAPDRLHHGLLGSILPEHPQYDPSGRFVEECRQYYRALDREIEQTLDLAGPNTVVMIVSDHGVRPLEGAVCINEWLIQEGYLTLSEMPSTPTPLTELKVDWSRTRAWGEGGHHGRICFNVSGREPLGIVSPEHLDKERDELIRSIEKLCGPNGEQLDNKVIVPEKQYLKLEGFPPDLMVYWDGLARRSIGTVGHGKLHSATNDLGHDEANHAEHGILVLHGPGVRAGGPIQGLKIKDVFATALDALGLDTPKEERGRSLLTDTRCFARPGPNRHRPGGQSP